MALYLFSININQQDVIQALKLYDNHIFYDAAQQPSIPINLYMLSSRLYFHKFYSKFTYLPNSFT